MSQVFIEGICSCTMFTKGETTYIALNQQLDQMASNKPYMLALQSTKCLILLKYKIASLSMRQICLVLIQHHRISRASHLNKVKVKFVNKTDCWHVTIIYFISTLCSCTTVSLFMYYGNTCPELQIIGYWLVTSSQM